MPLAGPVFLRAGVMPLVRLSFGANGAEANGTSQGASFSPDGHTVLFESQASNLVQGDNNGAWDIFSEDLITGAVSRVSTSATGHQANGSSLDAHFDSTGTRIVFDSSAPDLILSGDTNNARDVFVKDLVSGAVTLVSTSPAGIIGSGDSLNGQISPDGHSVAFESLATNLIGADTNHARDIYIKNLDTGQIIRASTDTIGGEANGQSADVVWSPDGGKVAFDSNASNLVSGDTNGDYDVFVKNLVSGAIARVSTAADGTQANGHSFHAQFTVDGHGLTFESTATNLIPGGTNGARGVYFKDLDTGAVTLLSTDSSGAQATGNSYAPTSAAGWTAFESNADLTGGGAAGHRDVYLRDANGADLRVSLGLGGALANADVFHPQIAADGSAVLFQSKAGNLVSGDANTQSDIFLAKLMPSVTSGSVIAHGASATGSLFFDDGNAAATHTRGVVVPDGAAGLFNATLATDATGAGAGRIDWSFGSQGFDALAAGEIKTETFAVTITDGAGHSATQPVTLTLTGINDAPVAADSGFHVQAGAVTTDQSAWLLASDTDVDHGDTLSISAIDTGGTQGTVTLDPVTHALTYAATATAFADLALGQSAADHFGYTVTDLWGATAHANVTVTIDGVGPPPDGTPGPDKLTAAPGGSILDGMAGNDTLIGGTGNDTLVGGPGTDSMAGGPGDDIYSVDDPGDVVIEKPGEGHDTVVASVSYTLPSNVDDLMLVGGNLNGTGNGLGNHITGTDGNNILEGGVGAPSILEGGKGNDTYVVDNPGDQVIAGAGASNTVLTALASYTLADNVRILAYTGPATQVFHASGNALGDTIHGGDGGNVLTGGAGNDTLTGGMGTNMIDGGGGADTLRGGGGPTTFVERRGETAGDFILDFDTSNTGDKLNLVGWGAGTTIAATSSGNWTITDGVDHHAETLKIIGEVHAGDVMFG